MAVRLNSSNALLCAALLLGACATSAPPLPPDRGGQEFSADAFTPEDLALSCDAIAKEQKRLERERKEANSMIEGNRAYNQRVGYMGALFLVPWVATEGNQKERDAVQQGYARQDTLMQLAGHKRCPL